MQINLDVYKRIPRHLTFRPGILFSQENSRYAISRQKRHCTVFDSPLSFDFSRKLLLCYFTSEASLYSLWQPAIL